MFGKICNLAGSVIVLILLSVQVPVAAPSSTAGVEDQDQSFWLAIKKTTLPDLFEMFIKRYPKSVHRAEAERRLQALQPGSKAMHEAQKLTSQTAAAPQAMLSPAAQGDRGKTRAPALAAPTMATAPAAAITVPTTIPAPAEAVIPSSLPLEQPEKAGRDQVLEEGSADMIILIQHNLNRVGCKVGALDGKWGVASQQAATRFAATVELPVVTALANGDLLAVLKGFDAGTCAPAALQQPDVKKIEKVRRAPVTRNSRKARKVKIRKKSRRKKVIVKKKSRKYRKKTVRKKSRKSKKLRTASRPKAKKKVRAARKPKRKRKLKTASKPKSKKKVKKASKRKVKKKVRTARKTRKKKKKKKASKSAENVGLILLKTGLAFGGGSSGGRPGGGGSNGGGGQFSVKKAK